MVCLLGGIFNEKPGFPRSIPGVLVEEPAEKAAGDQQTDR